MSLLEYIKDKYKEILVCVLSTLLIIVILLIFEVEFVISCFILIIILTNYLVIFIYNFIKRKYFYDNFIKALSTLDQKYLITEVIKEPNFIEGKKMLEYLYDIDKTMNEYVNDYKTTSKDFIEYIELWCHEIKTPLATSNLIIDNNQNEVTKNIKEEIDKIDSFIEQVLYYARSGSVEKDYIIKDTDLKVIVDKVIKKNRKTLINKKIKVDISNLHIVKTDSKWMEFIINQIIINSIKYSKDKNSIIKIYSKENKNNNILYIEDNGIGIKNDEIDRVFDKGFTGTNGRLKYNSTGFGLYLCKKLCDKLDHNVKITSIENEKTTVMIVFPKSNMINEIV